MKKPAVNPPLPPMSLEMILDPHGADEIEKARKSWHRSRRLKRFFAWSLFALICGTTGLSWAAVLVGPERLKLILDPTESRGDGYVGGLPIGHWSQDSDAPPASAVGGTATPEPSSLALMGIGALVAGAAAVRRHWLPRVSATS